MKTKLEALKEEFLKGNYEKAISIASKFQMLGKEKDAIIVASYGTFSTGINIRAINNIVFASPSKSRIRVLQSIGRGLRQSEDKSKVKLFDVSDNISYKSRQNFTYRHFLQRLNIYKEEQFKYEINRINL